jgi:chromosome partitioning protein
VAIVGYDPQGSLTAPAVKTIIHQRQLFASSMIDGRTASELDPRSTAAEEITALWRELSTHLRIDGKE